MAGHSKFKNIMHRKGAQDAKRAKVFTRIIREVQVAARMGLPDPEMNPRLKSAVASAKAANMPNDNIERAIKRAIGGGDEENFQEIRYEGYGPGGVAIIVEALTDNRNRTASEIRAAFTKYGGSLAETNSVSFQFDRVGVITFKNDSCDQDGLFDTALEAGALDFDSNEEVHEVICAPNELHEIREKLEAIFGISEYSNLTWRPQTKVTVLEDTFDKLLKLLAALDNSDDVQNISANYEVDDALLERIMS